MLGHHRGLRAAFALVATIGMAGTAGADQTLYQGVTYEEFLKIMQEVGHTATFVAGTEAQPALNAQGGGFNYSVNFYNCQGTPARCLQIQFLATFSGVSEAGLASLEEYETGLVFGKAYHRNGEAAVEHSMNINGGVTGDYLANNLFLWVNILTGFSDHIYKDTNAAAPPDAGQPPAEPPPAAFASEAEIRRAVVGNTINGSMKSTGAYTEYYRADGVVKGRNYEGKWRLDASGMCFDYGQGEACWQLVLSGPRVTWYRDSVLQGEGVIVRGNPNGF